MKILQLCKKFPYPLKDGEAIAVNSLGKAFHQLGAEVTLLAMNTSRHYYPVENGTMPLSHYKQVLSVPVDNRIKPMAAFTNLFSRDSYHIARFVSPAFGRQLKDLLLSQQFDVVQLETPYLAPYIPLIRQHSHALVSMRAHNVEHEIWQRITQNTSFPLKKWYLKHLTDKLRRYEIEQFKQYDVLIAISDKDMQVFRDLGFSGRGLVVPIGMDIDEYKPDFKSYKSNLSLGFIGSLDWMPNTEGLQWFLQKVWPGLLVRFPELQLHIAGRNTPGWLLNLQKPNVVVHGEVPDAADFINQHTIMIVPLLSGSGMRAKILEAMALGRVVITTTLGLEGIDASDRKEVLLANTPESFIQSLEFCISSNGQLEKIGRNAQQMVSLKYESLTIASRLLQAYADHSVVVSS